MFQEVRVGILEMKGKVGDISKETEDVNENQIDILQLKNTKPKIKNSLKTINSRFKMSEERIVYLKTDQ